MLPKQPKFEPGDPASPALLRRRNQLRPAGLEPDRDTTLRAVREPQPSLLPEGEPPVDDDSEPDIPPSPGAAAPLAAAPERVYGESGRRGRWLAAVAVAAVVVLGGSSWLLYHALTGRTAANGDVPYIAADAGPEKVRPPQEGGAQTANQDMRVYNEINGAKPPQEKEVLLPQPEAPMTPPTTAQPDSTQNQGSAQNQPAAIPSVPAPNLDLAPAAGSSTSPPAADPSTAAGNAAAPPTQTAMATGVFRVQLAAVKSADAAQTAWKKLTKTYPDVLKGLKLDVVRLDRGADGALYRVQAGPFADRSAAEGACDRLKGKNQPCLVVAP